MNKPIYEDPVVAEIHAIRAKMLADCGGDHQKLMERVRQNEELSKKSGRTIIPAPQTLPPEKTGPHPFGTRRK